MVLGAAHVNDLHFANAETLVDVLGGFEDLCLENVVGVALGLKLEPIFVVFELLLNPLIFGNYLVIQRHLLGLILNLLEFLFFGLELDLLLHFKDLTLSAELQLLPLKLIVHFVIANPL